MQGEPSDEIDMRKVDADHVMHVGMYFGNVGLM